MIQDELLSNIDLNDISNKIKQNNKTIAEKYNEKLTYCRYCGEKPIIYFTGTIATNIQDCSCLHVTQIWELTNKTFKFSHLNLASFFVNIWNARNEKHNPFIRGVNVNNE